MPQNVPAQRQQDSQGSPFSPEFLDELAERAASLGADPENEQDVREMASGQTPSRLQASPGVGVPGESPAPANPAQSAPGTESDPVGNNEGFSFGRAAEATAGVVAPYVQLLQQAMGGIPGPLGDFVTANQVPVPGQDLGPKPEGRAGSSGAFRSATTPIQASAGETTAGQRNTTVGGLPAQTSVPQQPQGIEPVPEGEEPTQSERQPSRKKKASKKKASSKKGSDAQNEGVNAALQGLAELVVDQPERVPFPGPATAGVTGAQVQNVGLPLAPTRLGGGNFNA